MNDIDSKVGGNDKCDKIEVFEKMLWYVVLSVLGMFFYVVRVLVIFGFLFIFILF